MFDPADTGWNRIYEYDKNYAKFLDSIGLVGEKVEVFGDPTESFIWITKKPQIMPDIKNPVGRPKTIKGIVSSLSKHQVKAPEREFKKGSFLPRKGYLKK